MTLFDIMGPIMVGPSSSHTAGAVRIGQITRKILGAQPEKAQILLHGSFADTGSGHGTDKALVAGLLGLSIDNPAILDAFGLAERAGMAVTMGTVVLRGAHPNTVLLTVSAGERTVEVNASSLGGGRIRVNAIDGSEATFSGEYPTLIIHNEDKLGQVAEAAGLLSEHGVNIATMQIYRDRRGGLAIMVIESDQPISEDVITRLRATAGIVWVVYLNMEEG
ncbi:MAG: L-serine ammonia-lyase, iron-sulfur-dependent subunit beta [Oscillospiraceae bacterium]